MRMAYERKDGTGAIFRVVAFQSDRGEVAFIERNTRTSPENFWIVGATEPLWKAIIDVDKMCR